VPTVEREHSSPQERLAELLATSERLLGLAARAGASAADVLAVRSTDFEVKVADAAIVTLTQATSKGLGLRVFVDGRLGFCTTSDFTPAALEQAAARAVALARESTFDPHNGLAEAAPGRLDAGALDLYDPAVVALPAETKIAWAHELERAARAADPRVRKFRDSGVSTGENESVLVTSRGAVRLASSTAISLWSNPIAEQEGELQSELWYDAKTHLSDLEPVEQVGRTAGERAARMLGAKPVKTQEVPVIFEPHMAAGLVGGMLGALNGDMIYKRASFLVGKLGEPIAASGLCIVDDPLLPRGLASTPFDGEALATSKKRVVDRGVLTTYLYDSYTARKAGAQPTANARRGYASLPHAGVFNFYVEAGSDDPAQIVRSCERAFWCTRGLGSGVNTVTGEYSRGANGLWIEHGEIVHPVQEVTIAGDFVTLLKSVDRIGRDLTLCGSLGAPTLRVAAMTVSGLRAG
jgi:PmbA protein